VTIPRPIVGVVVGVPDGRQLAAVSVPIGRVPAVVLQVGGRTRLAYGTHRNLAGGVRNGGVGRVLLQHVRGCTSMHCLLCKVEQYSQSLNTENVTRRSAQSLSAFYVDLLPQTKDWLMLQICFES